MIHWQSFWPDLCPLLANEWGWFMSTPCWTCTFNHNTINKVFGLDAVLVLFKREKDCRVWAVKFLLLGKHAHDLWAWLRSTVKHGTIQRVSMLRRASPGATLSLTPWFFRCVPALVRQTTAVWPCYFLSLVLELYLHPSVFSRSALPLSLSFPASSAVCRFLPPPLSFLLLSSSDCAPFLSGCPLLCLPRHFLPAAPIVMSSVSQPDLLCTRSPLRLHQ